MTHELILTSVAQGPEHGFSPVAVSAAVSPQVVELLCALSNHQHILTGSGKSSAVYSHFILPGGIEHVLSHIAEYRVDEQQQSNVLAHHVILEGRECVPEGPAWLLTLPGFHLSEWNGPPLQFPQGRPIPTLVNSPSLTRRQQIARQYRWLDPLKMAWTGFVDTESPEYCAFVQSNNNQIMLTEPPTTPCPTWQEATGDAGWGGILAATAFTGQPVVLIHNPGQNILPLFVEALALLPSYVSWQITFCTCNTNLPDEISCQWKGGIAGSAETKRLVDDPSHLVLDLTRSMGGAPSGKYVDFARRGLEHLLPKDADEYSADFANTDTKSYGEETIATGISDLHLSGIFDSIAPAISPPRRSSLFEVLLHQSSRTQFYILYGIMFVLVLFLLVLAVDQAGNLGIVQSWQNRNQTAVPAPPDEPEQEVVSELETEAVLEPETTEPDTLPEAEDRHKLFQESREEQKALLLQCLESFTLPDYLPLAFPNVQDGQIDIPEKTTFGELSPLHPFGAALELEFMPLFEVSKITIGTGLVMDAVPDLIWHVDARDTETDLTTPMFRFQLTESGLEMDWQPEGLQNQHLYDTILSSLGFLQLSVADAPETAKQIPLFAPVKTEPVKIAELVQRAESAMPESEMTEYVVESPFASELWQLIVAEMNPLFNVLLEVQAEPAGDWLQRQPSLASEFRAEVRTSQQVGKTTESGETVYEYISIPFFAEASLERVIWRGDEYAERLHSEEADIKLAKEDLDKAIARLQILAFEGGDNTRIREEREKHEAELRGLNLRLKEVESILEKLPEAYREIGQNDTWQFHYSLFLETPTNNRALLLLTTVPVR